ncbi:hypothetical protein [Kitasatospora sp. NPDC050543]|uniref:hypothetical protein n=1 Tax=Kitasatospora sp. NPDC050543 TaxID=3364054 RepID=UPI00378FADFD
MLPAGHSARLVDPLLGFLGAALERYDGIRLASAPPIRLRASVHVGPLTLPDHRGDAINEACRLVSSDAVRQAMTAAAANGLFLAAVLSDTVFRRSIHAERTQSLKRRQLLKATARVDGKPDFEETCWLVVPGMGAEVVGAYIVDQSKELTAQPQTPDSQSGVAMQSDGPPASVKQKGKATGKARLVQVGGNYITGGEES